jgi:[FeFe] hydrogenase H-cluster maturation GTPase HydF
MGLNNAPSAERLHIAIFGKRNVGKSSVINAIIGQNLAIVSDVKGTTTDPVYKAMELLPLGPVMIVDTPGLDDEGTLGELRIKKTYQVLNKTDVALLIVDTLSGITKEDREIIERFKEKNIPYITIVNKIDLADGLDIVKTIEEEKGAVIGISAKTKKNITELKELIGQFANNEQGEERRIVADLIEPSDFVVLVVPIDKAAPKGRLILPQQQTIRDILEADAVSIVVKEYELAKTLESLGKKPKLVITDSQAFAQVAKDTPDDIMLTSFSILFARYKGDLKEVVKGVVALENLKDGDKILIAEGCTHHRQCDDIGTVKLPRWIKEHVKKQVEFEFCSGGEFPYDLSKYKLIVHCGGCMLNDKEMKHRIACAKNKNIPITNYGILIAYMKGILKRSVEPFPDIYSLLK